MLRRNRLAFSTLGCPDWTWEDMLQNGENMGFSGVEIRGIGKELRADRLDCLLPENQRRTQMQLERHRMQICMIDTSCRFDEEAAICDALEESRAALELCRRMGIRAIRVFGDLLPKGREEETIRQTAKALSSICGYAESTGFVQVLLEIHGDFNTIEALSHLLPLMTGHPSFGLVWDIEHSFRAYGRHCETFYRLIRPYIRHVHVKDCRLQKTGGFTAAKPGDGTINIPQLVSWLEEDGYTGWYSFEWEKRWQPELPPPETAFPEYIAYMRQLEEKMES